MPEPSSDEKIQRLRPSDPRDGALFDLVQETKSTLPMILSLNWKDVDFEETEVKPLNERTSQLVAISIPRSKKTLQILKEITPRKGDNDPVFLDKRSPNKRLSEAAARKIFDELGHKGNIPRFMTRLKRSNPPGEPIEHDMEKLLRIRSEIANYAALCPAALKLTLLVNEMWSFSIAVLKFFTDNIQNYENIIMDERTVVPPDYDRNEALREFVIMRRMARTAEGFPSVMNMVHKRVREAQVEPGPEKLNDIITNMEQTIEMTRKMEGTKLDDMLDTIEVLSGRVERGISESTGQKVKFGGIVRRPISEGREPRKKQRFWSRRKE